MTPELKPGMSAPHGTALDALGNPVELASLWFGRATLLVFLRHFG